MFRYVHTNIIAKDCNKLIQFYKDVLHCKSINETRDQKGGWLDGLTSLKNAHIKGEHLLLPGYGDILPTLEIYSYDEMVERDIINPNCTGIAHLAFEVDNVEETLEKIIAYGGSVVGEIVKVENHNNTGRKAMFVYARDIEGNILELQSWG